jgi:polyhydroxybutyrate depolymerase
MVGDHDRSIPADRRDRPAGGPGGVAARSYSGRVVSPQPARRRWAAFLLAAAVLLTSAGCGLFGPDIGVSGVDATWTDVPGDDGRRALAVVPDAIPEGNRVPLLVVLHGLGMTAVEMARQSGFAAAAPERGYVAVFASGTADSFAAGRCCGEAVATAVDDVDYLRRLITDAWDRLPVDPDRTYLVGYSNGGMMTYRFLCEGADLLAGAASIAGSDSDDCQSGPIPRFLQVSGADDTVVPPSGGEVIITGPVEFPPVDEVLASMADVSGCPARPQRSRSDRVVSTSWGPCARGGSIRHDVIEGAGHLLLPEPASPLVLDFFELGAAPPG